MAQGFEKEAVAAFQRMPAGEYSLLAAELARTGHRDQFKQAPRAVCESPAGPAIFVYYAPALVQKAGAAQAGNALLILAAVFRAARQIFPLEIGAGGATST